MKIFHNTLNFTIRAGLVFIGIYFISFKIYGQTKKGLFFSEEEVEIWKKRAVHGPYKSVGDVSPNSPGDWDRIKANANAFIGTDTATNYLKDRWSGPKILKKGRVERSRLNEPGVNGTKIRDAAFYYLITDDVTCFTKVRSELLFYATTKKLDFSNHILWEEKYIGDVNPGFAIAEFMTRLLISYDFIKHNLSSNDTKILNLWFRNAAKYFQTNIDPSFYLIFQDYRNEDYTVTQYGKNVGISQINSIAYFGHRGISNLAKFYNNRMAAALRFVSLVGIMQHNISFKNTAWFFFKGWLKFSVFPDGIIGEYERWGHEHPDLGWGYAGSIISSMVEVADAFARSGDSRFYKYNTSFGLFGTQGGNKNLKLVMDKWIGFLDGTYIEYGTDEGVLFNTSISAVLPGVEISYTAKSAPGGWSDNPTKAVQMAVRRNAFNKGEILYRGWTKKIGALYNVNIKAQLPSSDVLFTTHNAEGGWTSTSKNAKKKAIRTEYDLGWRFDLVTSTKMYIKNENPLFIIDGKFEDPYGKKWFGVQDTYLAQSNLYYRDKNIRAIYTRSKKNTSQYPYEPAFPGWGGIGFIFPGKLFMFGQMENSVNPYPCENN